MSESERALLFLFLAARPVQPPSRDDLHLAIRVRVRALAEETFNAVRSFQTRWRSQCRDMRHIAVPAVIGG